MLRYSSPKRILIRGERTKHFYCRVYDTATRKRAWRSTGRTSLKAAQEEIKTWQIEEAQGKRTPEARTVGEAVTEWLDTKRSKLTGRALDGYRAYSADWLKHFGQGTLLRGIEHEHVEAYFARRADVAAPGTLNRERNTLRQFFKWTRLRGWLEGDPTATIPRYVEPRRTIRALSDEDAAALLRACQEPYGVTVTGKRSRGGKAKATWRQSLLPPEWLHPFVMLLMKTGLRSGTLRALEWHDADLDARLLRIPAEKMKAREALDLPIDDEAVDFLKRLKARATSLRILEGVPHRTVVRTTLLHAAARAKVRPLRVHDLRATWVSRARRAGIPLEVTARLAGHADVRTTLRFYRQLDEEELRAAVEKLATKKGPRESTEGAG